MKPHELIARQRRSRGQKVAPPQMRDRNATAAAPGGPAAQLPARRPTFPGETRQQELDRQRAAATVVKTGPAGMVPVAPQQPGALPAPQQQQAQQQPAIMITMCACTSHIGGACENVATLRAVWPVPDGLPLLLDVCEVCAAAIADDPVGQMVTGLAFVALFGPAHDELEPEEPAPGPAGKTDVDAQPAKVTP